MGGRWEKVMNVPRSETERRLQVMLAKDYILVYATIDELIAITVELVEFGKTKLAAEQAKHTLRELKAKEK